MSKRCKLQKEYYKEFGNYKGSGKYTDHYVSWLESKVLAINYTRCCETLRDEKAPTIEVNLNTKESAYKRCNEITKVLKAPSRLFFYDGENYIELKP